MNQQDQQAIDELFRHLYRTAEQAGPRDQAAEALIQRYVDQAPPGLLYQMAQLLVAQQHTLNELRAQLGAYQQGAGAPAGFAAPPRSAYQGYGQPQYQQQPAWQQGRPGGGFLAGAGKLALGIGGGILGAEVLTDIFRGAGGLFDGDRDREYYDDGYQQGFAAGDEYRDDAAYQGQGSGGFDDQGQFDDPGAYNDPGMFDDGGYDGDGGTF